MHKYTGFALLALSACIPLSGAFLPANGQGIVISGDSAVLSSGAGNLSVQSGMGDTGSFMPNRVDAGSVGDVHLSDLNSSGAMSAGRDISCRACRIEGNVSAGRDIHLEHSPQVGAVAAGHDVTLLDSHVLGSISAGHGITLSQSQVQGSLSTGNEADLQASTVQGSLSQGGHHLKLDASTVRQDVYFQGTPQMTEMGQVAMSGQSSMIHSRNGSSFVRVSGHSLSRVNGFTIQGAEGQTTVITPQQTIYVNGKRVSGEGPKTYAQYRQDNLMAPSVEGPGWLEDGGIISNGSGMSKNALSKSPSKNSPQPILNWLELSNQSQINGQVVFESGFGKVLLHPGSRINGQVVNGTVEKLPN